MRFVPLAILSSILIAAVPVSAERTESTPKDAELFVPLVDSYGHETAVADIIAAGIGLVGAFALSYCFDSDSTAPPGNGDTSCPIMKVALAGGAATFIFASPINHVRHDNAGGAATSFLLRFVVAGGTAALGILEPGAAILGGVVGVGATVFIDAVHLSEKHALVPLVTSSDGGELRFGLAGSF